MSRMHNPPHPVAFLLLTICINLVACNQVDDHERARLMPPVPVACSSCKPDNYDLPFDPPVEGVIYETWETLTGANESYYIVDIKQRRVCNFYTVNKDIDYIKKNFSVLCKYHDKKSDYFNKVIELANIVWRSRKIEGLSADAGQNIYIFDHDRSYFSVYEIMPGQPSNSFRNLVNAIEEN